MLRKTLSSTNVLFGILLGLIVVWLAIHHNRFSSFVEQLRAKTPVEITHFLSNGEPTGADLAIVENREQPDTPELVTIEAEREEHGAEESFDSTDARVNMPVLQPQTGKKPDSPEHADKDLGLSARPSEHATEVTENPFNQNELFPFWSFDQQRSAEKLKTSIEEKTDIAPTILKTEFRYVVLIPASDEQDFIEKANVVRNKTGLKGVYKDYEQ